MQRLKLFGGISIETETGRLTGRAVQRRRLALLALLASAGSRGMSRDKLTALLWPDADAETGRRFLSDSVYRVNQALGVDAILAVGDNLRLDSQRVPSDLGDYADAIAAGNHAEAVAAYGGPFLDGFFLSDSAEFERWVDAEREQYARAHSRALESLAVAAENNGDRAGAADWWRKLVQIDPLNSRIALSFMRALDAAGERAVAIQHARVHAALLEGELGIEPDAAVEAFVEQLRSESQNAAQPVATVATTKDVSPEPALPTPSVTAELRDLSAVEPIVAAAVAPLPAPRPRPRKLVWSWGVAALIAITTVSAAFRTRPTSHSVETSARSVVVLPFANLSADRDNEYFSDGITEELISTLSKVNGLQVASRTSAFSYKNRPADVRDVAQRLGVTNVVEGSVRKSGKTLRISVRLVSASNGYQLWSEEYVQELDDVLRVQQEISRAIVSRLTGTLLGATTVNLAEEPTQDPVAYDLYLKGRFAWHQRTQEGLKDAIRYFEQAITKSPNYARAYVGLGDAYAVGAFYDYIAPKVAYPQAEAAARNALRIDPTLAAPHATLGYVLTFYQLDWPRAEEEFKQALALDPAYSIGHVWYANLLTVAERFSEAEHEMRLAQESDPLSLVATGGMAWTYYFAGRSNAALQQSDRATAMNADFEMAHVWRGWALEKMGRRGEARESIERAIRHSQGSVLTRLALAHVLAGDSSATAKDSAWATAREMDERRIRGEYVPSYEIAKLHLALGDRAGALAWMKRAYDERSHWRALVNVDPQLAGLRGDTTLKRLTNSVSPIAGS